MVLLLLEPLDLAWTSARGTQLPPERRPRAACSSGGPQKLVAAGTGSGQPSQGLGGAEAIAPVPRSTIRGVHRGPVLLPEVGAGVWGVGSNTRTTPVALGDVIDNRPPPPFQSSSLSRASNPAYPPVPASPADFILTPPQPPPLDLPAQLGLTPSQSSGRNWWRRFGEPKVWGRGQGAVEVGKGL